MKCLFVPLVALQQSRPLCGGRGLKYVEDRAGVHVSGSPPVRGAWVEMSPYISRASASKVAPCAGGVG